MKKVTLAYPYTDGDGTTHEPDTTLELDDVQAKRLVQDGKARPADEPAQVDPPPTPDRSGGAKGGSNTTPKVEG
jgi:hypothetical protein